MISNSKIEDRALTTLKNIIDMHNTMQYKFNSMDKEMIWDGYINIFIHNNGKQSKDNLDDRIPVQIKGHVDSKNKYIKKNKITYPVEIKDLKSYFRDRGVVYFIIFMSPDGNKRKVYYSSLLPSKIKYYLNQIKKNRNKFTVNITFNEMKQDPNTLYLILKQFSNESRLQGFGEGIINQNSIKFKDLTNDFTLKCSAIGVSSYIDVVKKMASGEINLYEQTSTCPVPLLLEYNENMLYSVEREHNDSIKIRQKIYYRKFKTKFISDDQYLLILSDNMTIDVKNKNISFSPVTTLEEIKKDVEFIIEWNKNKYFTLNKKKIYITENLNDSLIKKFKQYVDLYNILYDLKISLDVPFSKLNPETKKNLNFLYGLKSNIKNFNNKESYNDFFQLNIEDKIVNLAIFGKYPNLYIENFLYSNRVRVSISQANNNYVIPNFAYLSIKDLCNLNYYDITFFEKQIDDETVNEYTVELLKVTIMQLICIYDTTYNKKILKLCEKQLNKIEQLLNIIEIKIVKIIIKIRKNRILSQNDIIFLDDLNVDNNINGFIKFSLLCNEKKANSYYELISKDEYDETLVKAITNSFNILLSRK